MISKIIYVYKISNTSPFFPLNHPVSSLTFFSVETSIIKYFPSRKEDGFFDRVEGSGTISPEMYILSPISETLSNLLTKLFTLDVQGTVEIETEKQFSVPLAPYPFTVKTAPDYLVTIQSRPEISLLPTECENTLIPWRYKLPDQDEWVEMDALGANGMGYAEDLELYLKGG